jgi:hypothetical protein
VGYHLLLGHVAVRAASTYPTRYQYHIEEQTVAGAWPRIYAAIVETASAERVYEGRSGSIWRNPTGRDTTVGVRTGPIVDKGHIIIFLEHWGVDALTLEAVRR